MVSYRVSSFISEDLTAIFLWDANDWMIRDILIDNGHIWTHIDEVT